MSNCTFTYPGRDKPSLHNVTAAVSLSSRVGIGKQLGLSCSTFSADAHLQSDQTVPVNLLLSSCLLARPCRTLAKSRSTPTCVSHISLSELIRCCDRPLADLNCRHAFHHIEQHLEKSATQYIKWRYADGHDKELAEKASRKMSEEEKKTLETPIEAKTGEKRRIEMIIGRQKLKKSFTYEIKWLNMDHKVRCLSRLARFQLIQLGTRTV